ncbi:MAG: transcriptional regulator NrdR [Christensenellales bacterium]
MKCMYCGCIESKVIDSRPTEEGLATRRRRECINCGKRFTTYEKIETAPLFVIKKDGSREVFDREKILRGISKACQKRPVSAEAMDQVASEIEKEVFNTLEKEVTTKQIGELVMQKLKVLDEVAYVRFASVYRQFRDINTFMEELTKLLEER